MLMSHSQRAVFEYLQVEKGHASIGYSGRLREDAYGRITEEQLIKLCMEDNQHYFGSHTMINANRYFRVKLYTD